MPVRLILTTSIEGISSDKWEATTKVNSATLNSAGDARILGFTFDPTPVEEHPQAPALGDQFRKS